MFPFWNSFRTGFCNLQLAQITSNSFIKFRQGTKVGKMQKSIIVFYLICSTAGFTCLAVFLCSEGQWSNLSKPSVKHGRRVYPLEMLKRKNSKWNSHWKLVLLLPVVFLLPNLELLYSIAYQLRFFPRLDFRNELSILNKQIFKDFYPEISEPFLSAIWILFFR